MSSNAPGQLLGYTIQFPRALYHLLKSAPGDAVSIEVLGDVATSLSNGNKITEEDKSSIVGNPLTNKSTDLWKTFSNWINAINNGDLNINKTMFILYTNQSGRHGIVNDFHDAQNENDILLAISNAKSVLKDIDSSHDIWKFYDFVINKNETLLMKIIDKFELQITEGVGYENINHELRRLLIPESQIDFFADTLGGWLQRVILEKIALKEIAIIQWEEYRKQFEVLFDRAHRRELIDFALTYPPDKEKIETHIKVRPNYLKQLDFIDSSDDDIIEAVSDFIRADINRTKWIENEIIDEDIAFDFELKLKNYWENQKKRIELTEKTLTEKEQGILLYSDCKIRQETIRDMAPPSSTIAGTYHAMANEPSLGWHPKWLNLFSSQDEE